ncbi:MAG: YbaK/EbsC family protein [Parachlamydiales bacterium]|nr:YbaK/EbsC family protein [Verrucomicrobiota bacterium]MBX3719917.1 YbaK/EbsC family protein [Candidatus Acheromyda pituitae]
MQLTKNAQTIQELLSQRGIDTKVIEFPASTRTAADAAAAIGCDAAQILKSLIFQTKNTHRPILVLVSGLNRVNEQLIEAAVGEPILKADADFTRKATGFAIGGIPPIGHLQRIETYIDEDLLKLDLLWAAAGTPHSVFSIHSNQIANLTEGTVIQVKT